MTSRFLLKTEVLRIGSCVAPILCNILLAKFYSMLQGSLQDSRVVRIFRYVDDFLVILNLTETDRLTVVVDQILNIFSTCSKNLVFAKEVPDHKIIRFLDLELTFLPDRHVCWKYAPRSKKVLLPYESAHSKLVKRSIANLCFLNALKLPACDAAKSGGTG